MAASAKSANASISEFKLPLELYDAKKIADTLQGSIWRAFTTKKKDTSIVIKLTDREQSNKSICILHNRVHHILENIISEQRILRYITQQTDCSPFITKFLSFFETDTYFILIQQDGCHPLFDFIRNAHTLIKSARIPMANWQLVVKIIFKQLLGSIAYIHSKNVCHNDISLENYVISDVNVDIDESGKLEFVTDDIQVKLCDFGLAELHTNDSCLSNKHCGKMQYKSPEVINLKRNYSGKKNDIWAIGVCLFMLSYGCQPWSAASITDETFSLIMNGRILDVLHHWRLLKYIDPCAIDLLQSIFKYEEDRISVSEIDKHPFMDSTTSPS